MSDGIHWTVALERNPAFAEFTRVVEKHIDTQRKAMENLRPGAPSDAFQRFGGEITALRWALNLTNSQKPKPGDKK